MEALNVLEKKIVALVELVQTLKFENSTLIEEIARLSGKLAAHEAAQQGDVARIEKLDMETESTKKVIGDLIQQIDSFIECEKLQ